MGTVHAKEFGESQSEEPPLPHNGTRREIVLSSVPVVVDKIHFDGLKRTKDDIVTEQIKEVFAATNFEDMVKRAQLAKRKMERIGLFKKVGITIDISTGSDSSTNGYEVTYDVQEHRRVTGGISTLVGTNEGSLLFSVKMPNVFGRGEKIDTQYTYGTKNTSGYSFVFSKPLKGDPNIVLSGSAFRNEGEFPYSGFKELDHGITADLSFLSMLGSHELRWEGMWRDLSCLTKTTPFSVREQSGHSLKSALKHTLVRDSRDDRVLPNTGYLLRLTQEVAGLGGDANFHKHDAELQFNQPLPLSSVLQFTLAGGVMKSIHPGSEIKIHDNFFVGGPLTLRGFNLKGVGPSEDSYALGANAYWCGGLHLYTPLPFRPGKGGFGDLFRTHFFVNAGNLTNINFSDEWRTNMRHMAETLRLTYGAGLLLKMGGIARLELNYCWPFKVQQGDSVCPGVQFGIGITFL